MGNQTSSTPTCYASLASVGAEGLASAVRASEPIFGPTGAAVRYQFAPSSHRPPVALDQRFDTWYPAAERIALTTSDSKKLDACWVGAGRKGAPAVILFHGNGMVLDDMADWAVFYHQSGFNVLLLSFRGYGKSEGSISGEGEEGMYRDAAAAVDHCMRVQRIPTPRIVAHGYSLGGSAAAAAAYYYGLGGLVLDHTFTSAEAVANNVKGLIAADSKAPWWSYAVSEWMVNGVARAAWPAGQKFDVEGTKFTTDGLCTVQKVRHYGQEHPDSSVTIIHGTEDAMMRGFAHQLEAAHQPPPRQREQQLQQTRLLSIPGGGHEYSVLPQVLSALPLPQTASI